MSRAEQTPPRRGQHMLALRLGIAACKRTTLEVSRGSNQHRRGIGVGHDKLCSFRADTAAARDHSHLSRKSDLVLVFLTFAQDDRVLPASVDAEVGRPMLARKFSAPFRSALSCTTITSSGLDAKISRV